MALGADHICGIDGGGQLKCWGSNEHNQCDIPTELRGTAANHGTTTPATPHHDPNGTQADSSTPTLAVGLENVVSQTAAGSGQTCAISGTGKLHCWGSNQYGQTEVNTALFSAQTQAISTGGDHTCGIDAEGKIVCWGNNLDKQCNVP